MSKKWEKVAFDDVVTGDVLRMSFTAPFGEGAKGTYQGVAMVDGEVGLVVRGIGRFTKAHFEGDNATFELSRKKKKPEPFVWPTKLGAVVTGVDRGDTQNIVYRLVFVGHSSGDPVFYDDKLWEYTLEYLESLELDELTILSEGVDTPEGV